VALALGAAALDLVAFEVCDGPVEDEHGREVVLEELRQALDDANEVCDLIALRRGVGVAVSELDSRRQVPVEPVVRVHGDHARELPERHLLDDRQVPKVRVSHRRHVGAKPA